MKKRVLTPIQINYLLQQMLAFTFLCIVIFVEHYIKVEFRYLKIGIHLFTLITLVIYEIIINVLYYRAKKNTQQEVEEKELVNHEKFLWFEILFLIDTVILIAYLSVVTKIHIAIIIVLGFAIFYIISMLIKPYFGIKHQK